MKQGLVNDLTRYILLCYCILSKLFIGRFLSGKILSCHVNTRLYCQTFLYMSLVQKLVIRQKFVIFATS